MTYEERKENVSDEAELSLGKKSIAATADGIAPKLMDPSDLIVKMEYRNMYPTSEADFQKLKTSMEYEGQKVPVIVNQRYEIIDGDRRTRACRELDKRVWVEVRHFDNPEEEKKLIHILNLARRHLPEYAKIKVVVMDEDFIKEQSRKRQLSALRRGSSAPLVLNQTDGEMGRTDQICADHAGVPLNKYRRVRDLIKSKAISEQAELELIEGKEDLDKILRSLASKINRQPKKIRQFKGETLIMSPKTQIIQGRFQDVNPLHIAANTLLFIFPTFDFSYDRKLVKDVATFASRYLDKKGFLVLYVGQDSLGSVIDAVTRTAKDLKLLYALPVNFPKEWQNLVGYLNTHTVIYLIFGRGYGEDSLPFLTFSFNEPICIDLDSEGEEHTEELKPELANPLTVDYLIEGLFLTSGRICDPLCGNGDALLRFLEKGFDIVGVESDPSKFETLKNRMERQLKKLDSP